MSYQTEINKTKYFVVLLTVDKPIFVQSGMGWGRH